MSSSTSAARSLLPRIGQPNCAHGRHSTRSRASSKPDVRMKDAYGLLGGKWSSTHDASDASNTRIPDRTPVTPSERYLSQTLHALH
jgi:hypothetical protein